MHVGTEALLADPSTQLLVQQPPAEQSLGPLFAGLTADEAADLRQRLGHVQEVLSGFRSGSAATAITGEPRPEFHPARPLTDRYEAKARELGIGVATVRRWVGRFRQDGPAGLLDRRAQRSSDPLAGIDQRWLDVCAAVLDEHTDASRPTGQLLLERIEARLDPVGCEEAVPRPSARGAQRAVAELSRGTNAFVGSTKGKRSIANRPEGVYGRLRATRPGEYLLLDTTRLDVFAMEPLTLRWVNLELTVALDLYSRCVVGLRLSPVSTKAVDAGLILDEALQPDSRALTGCGVMPTRSRSRKDGSGRWKHRRDPGRLPGRSRSWRRWERPTVPATRRSARCGTPTSARSPRPRCWPSTRISTRSSRPTARTATR